MNIKLWKWLSVLGICLSTWLTGQEPYTLIEDQLTVPFLIPSLAKRQTLKLRLPNGLEAYLISDPDANKAGAVLTVQAGSWNDPVEYPGLAHFLEHMLFLGTEKYPLESDYDRFIHENDGKANAYTASDYTLYLFSISPKAFEEALDRFAFFFKKPLFNPSGVSRELHAIEQEFTKNFNQDSLREHYVLKEIASAQHPFHRFSAGNLSTLAKVSQKTLREWHQKHYSAHLMRLIVQAPFPLEKLQSWVLQNFNDIPSTYQQPFYPQVPVLTDEMQGKIVYIEPVKNTRSLHLLWELPALASQPNSLKAEDFVATLLGDEGPGSLLANLKAEFLAEGLGCSGLRLGKHHLLFSLEVHLTQEGLQQIEQVINRCFQAINILQNQELPPYLFEEFKKIHTIRYQYQPREEIFNYLMKMGGLLVYEDLKNFPESALISQTFDPVLIRDFLNYLSPQRVHAAVMASHPDIAGSYNQKERWMGIPYKVQELSFELLPRGDSQQLHLPPPNPFIPREFKIIEASAPHQSSHPIQKPVLLEDNTQAKIYYAADTYFQVPQTLLYFEIKTPFIEQSDPQKVAMADLYLKCLEEALNPYSYPAQVADLSYTLSHTENGILMSLTGYGDNIDTLFDTILEQMNSCHPPESLFQICKDSLSRQYYNANCEGPLQQGYEVFRSILYESYSSPQQRAAALEKITYGDFLHYLKHLYDQTYTEGLIYGNLSQTEAQDFWKKLQSSLSNPIYPPVQRLDQHIVVLPNSLSSYALELPVESSSHAAILSIENPYFSFKTRAAQQILAQAMSAPFYATLRTKQQTGYLLFSRTDEFNQRLFTTFAVQSSSHDPRDLLARFELFIEDFLQEMGKNELTEERFEHIRDSLLNTLENPPQNFLEAGQLLKTLAFTYKGDFEWMTKRIQGFKELSYEEFLEIASQFLGKQNKRRLAILMRGSADKDFHYHTLSNPQTIRELSQYPCDMPCP